MKRILLIGFFVLLGLAGLVHWGLGQLMPPPAQAATLDAGQAERAQAFLDLLDKGAYADAVAFFDDTMRQGLPADKLQEVWETLPRQVGPLKSRGAARGERIGETDLVTTPLLFEKFSLDARIAFDAEGRMTGFRLVPAQSPPAAPAPPARGEREISLGEGPHALPATFRLPTGEGPFPAVVLVHGSGPHDRDQSIGPHRSFRDLAEGLAAHGVASLRFEKRTRAHPEQFADGRFGIDLETVDDAVAAVALLTNQPEIDASRVHVLGHSLGAMMTPRILQRAPQAAGGILLAAPARPLEAIILEQFEYLASLQDEPSQAAAVAAQLDAVSEGKAAVEALDASVPDAQPLLLGLPAAYWRSLAGYDPVEMAAGLPQPLLVLQGGRDYQVTVEGDFARWQSLSADSERVHLKLYPELNHLFIAGEGRSRPEEYLQAGEQDPRLAIDIADWIREQRR